jgi:nucleoid-associated protein YgaU
VNPPQIRQPLSAPRTRGLALTGSGLVLLAMLCLQLASASTAAWRSVLEPGPASIDQALAAICGSVALAIALWLLSALLLSVLAALGSRSSAVGTTVTSTAHILAPKALRNAVAAVLGVAIAAGPATAQASARHVASELVATRSRGAQALLTEGLSPAWAPVVTATVRPAVPSPTPTSTPRPDLLPGWTPARPPRPTSPTSTTNAPSTRTPPTGTPLKITPPTGTPPKNTPPKNTPPTGAPHTSTPSTSTPPRSAPSRSTPPTSDDEVIVHRGDTLWSIAERHLGPAATNAEIARDWPHWFTANRDVIGNDPDHLVPDERLHPPEPHAHLGRHRAGTATRSSSRNEAKPTTRDSITADSEIRGG